MTEKKTYQVPLGRGSIFKVLLQQKPQAQRDEDAPVAQKRKPDNMIAPVQRVDDDIVWLPSAPGLMIYDMGQEVDDDDNATDIDYGFQPTITIDGGGMAQIEAFGPEQFADFHSFLGIDAEASELRERYKKITYEDAERYGLYIGVNQGAEDIPYLVARNGQHEHGRNDNPLIENSKWKEPGVLKTKFGVGDNNYFFTWVNGLGHYQFDAWDYDRVKVTEEPDYEADSVTMPAASKAEIFLVPKMCCYMVRLSPPPGIGGTEHYGGLFYRPFSRNKWLHNPTFEAFSRNNGGYAFSVLAFSFFGHYTINGLLDWWVDLAQEVMDDPLAQYIKISPSNVWTIGLSPGTFPMDKDGTVIIAGIETFLRGQSLNPNPKPGTLYAIVVIGQKKYYIWATNPRDDLGGSMNFIRILSGNGGDVDTGGWNDV